MMSWLMISFSLWFLRTSASNRRTPSSVSRGEFLPGLGDLEALLLERDDLIQVLEPFVEAHQPVIILGDIRDQAGHEVVPPLDGGDVALPRRVPGIPQLPVDVQLPGEVDA